MATRCYLDKELINKMLAIEIYHKSFQTKSNLSILVLDGYQWNTTRTILRINPNVQITVAQNDSIAYNQMKSAIPRGVTLHYCDVATLIRKYQYDIYILDYTCHIKNTYRKLMNIPKQSIVYYTCCIRGHPGYRLNHLNDHLNDVRKWFKHMHFWRDGWKKRKTVYKPSMCLVRLIH